ncbi:DUF551 domain-containing protein [Enterobacter hormaechei]|uniref:DUF551 domain-containing protein n=1 Tax=Enterobacter cloacae complex TaxID=354276 RepID=UPI00079295A7|nr:DUF551 domain-containing protein [Enterobacter hormaechei]MCL8101770.1 DUF551 domain-containing protein [Enterobacter hormaechei]MCL8105620.1 DUF551 domain-containing protein [Enterobacter hormaechei]MCM8309333.1 DUF551 domain-containing protein [Enterobacter hormaechei]MCM8370323.1 DUF551 domain-containing protein [Enterobacter hormaechei]MCM8375252.1 DUF551 domain-containing protein [Enterobacter hormaechei]
MSTMTKERAAQIAAGGGFNFDEIAVLARIALASLEAEPVGEVVLGMYDDCGCHPDARVACIAADGQADWENFKDGTRLYTAPPAPVSVPAAMEMDDDFDSAFEHGKAVGWNAYRAAMLQSFGNSEQLNSPVIQDGWVACVERMPSAGEQVLAYRPDAPESNDPLIKMATYVGGSAHGHGFDCYCKPTHWMPLPAAPQQEA